MNMNMKLGAGIFIVREDANADLKKTLEKVAAIGYDGIELVGYFGRTAAEVKEILKAVKLLPIGDHVQAADIISDPKRVLGEHLDIGCKYITLTFGEENVKTLPFNDIAAQCEEAVKLCLEYGITPMYHNHAFDMQGESPFTKRLLDAVPQLNFEPDVGWMLAAGQDPAYYLRKYKARIPVVHFKDVFVTEEGFTFRPTGYGNVNTPALLPLALDCNPEWLMVDHDLAYERDSYEDLKLSYDYMRALLKIAK